VRRTAVSFENALAAAGVEPIESVGEQFNPELHEAVETAELSRKMKAKFLRNMLAVTKLANGCCVQRA